MTNFGDGGTFDNNGVFTRNTGTGTFTIGGGVFVFNNTGTLTFRAGPWTYRVETTATRRAALLSGSGTILQFDGTYTLAAASTIHAARER